MRYRIFGLLLLLCAGCFPVDVDVNRSGEILIPRDEGVFLFESKKGRVRQVAPPGDGRPVHARFAPNGKDLLIALDVGKGAVDGRIRLALLPLAGGEERKLFEIGHALHARFSPDGKHLTVLACPGYWRGGAKVPELHVVDIDTGQARRMLDRVGRVVDWFADSRRLLVFMVKGGGSIVYAGDLAILDVITGKTTPLASAVASADRHHMTLTPDERQVLFTAYRADAPGKERGTQAQDHDHLFALDLEGKEIKQIDLPPTSPNRLRQVGPTPHFFRYSPDGKRILLTWPADSNFSGCMRLAVADADFKQVKRVDRFLYQDGGNMPQHIALPGWIDDSTLYYFTLRLTYGKVGRATHLVTVGIDGQNKRYVQPALEMGILAAQQARGE